MGVRSKIAATPDEIDAVFRVQHAVFVEEEGYMLKRPDRRLFDRFDTLPAEDE
jgi:N-acyl-L-homoserine lactone synthetase